MASADYATPTTFLFAFLPTILFVSHSSHFVNSYTCETPEEWLKIAPSAIFPDNSPKTEELGNFLYDTLENDSVQAANFRQLDTGGGWKWPGGVVKYQLDSSLEASDIQTVKAAFKEYHRKTCIKFEPWTTGDVNFTRIEITDDHKICGIANVCMRGGYQFARIGKRIGCRQSVDVMIHEFGHTICLDHEQVRPDRDDWVSFDGCKNVRTKHNMMSNPLSGIYDYSSQMHYDCGTCDGGFPRHDRVKNCGRQVSEGLSLLDADTINYMYNCQGCFRHRWKGIRFLTAQDRKFMYSFGYTDINGYSIFPCRAFFQGEIVIGKYTHQQRRCVIAWRGEQHTLYKNVEVLTIPGGIEQTTNNGIGQASIMVTHRYELASIRSISMQQVIRVGVPSGRTLDSDAGQYWEGVGYIAFGAVEGEYDREEVFEESIGTVWRRKWDDYPIASFSGFGREHFLSDNFKILVCNKFN